jgi:glycosyltransferase involved in cell wall biosynthesis
MKTMHFAGTPGTGYGWGVFNANMYRELDKHFVMVTSKHDPVDVCFMPVDGAFRPLTPARGKVNVCMNFFESPLEPDAQENAAQFDVCFVGSTWCQQRCAEAGILNTRVLIQGVDGDTFKPQPPREPDGAIRIFSGGKFEYRKGQDLVIAAFREFAKVHPEAHLVCAWHNPWPALFKTMAHTKVISPLAHGATQPEFFRSLMHNNGLADSQFTILPQLSHTDLAREMANTDFGLFPNRCEGGNNLVLQEYASCGRRVVANAMTGHADVSAAITQRIHATEDENRWAVQTTEEIAYAMKGAMMHSLLYPQMNPAPVWTWEAASRTVLAALS